MRLDHHRLQLLYKLPGQLEAHNKKTIIFSSELSTLSFGQNAVALTAFAHLLTSEENTTTTLPAIPLLNNEPDDTLRTGMLGLFLSSYFH